MDIVTVSNSNVLDYLHDPSPRTLGRSPLEWLEQLQKPTVVRVAGRDRSRTRAMATLLHGNEPSGLFALHRWLLEQHTPEVNMLFLLGGVYPAKIPPTLSLRQLPAGRDLNRCFKEPFAGEEGAIAKAMLSELHDANPECLLDVHNTSGTGPAFAVTITNDAAHQALTSLFTDRLIMTDLRLGALMEYSEQEVPTVTIECGGSQDDQAHQLAYEGLARYASRPDVLSLEKAEWDVEVLRNPIRVELVPEATIEYLTEPPAGLTSLCHQTSNTEISGSYRQMSRWDGLEKKASAYSTPSAITGPRTWSRFFRSERGKSSPRRPSKPL